MFSPLAKVLAFTNLSVSFARRTDAPKSGHSYQYQILVEGVKVIPAG